MNKMSKKEKKKIAVFGVDSRLLAAADALSDEGFDVTLFGDGYGSNIVKTLHGADAVLLGVPASTDGKYICGLGDGKAISFKALFEKMGGKCPLLFGGGIGEDIKKNAPKYGVRCVDYLPDEAFALRNALTTAEGAVNIMMNELPVTVFGSSAVITGFGRVGRALCRCLISLGASVTVCARSASDRAAANCMGASVCDIPKGEANGLPWCDVIFNTVPDLILGEAQLENISGETLLVELASVPGGIDASAAAKTGHKLIIARGLPGKTSPVTAGRDICRAVIEMWGDE